MQANPFSDLIPAGRRQQPLIPQAAPAQTPGQLEHQNLSNEALRLQNEAAQQHLDPQTIDMLAHQYILAGPPALQGVGGMGRTAAANRMAILNRAAEIAGARPGENVQVGFSRYRNGVHALQNLENQLGTISTNEQTAIANGEQMLARIREVYPPNSTRPGNIARGLYRDFFNDRAMTAFDAARNTFLTEYAKVVAGSPSGAGVLSDTARREQQDNLRRATSPEAAQSALNQMRRDMENRIQAFQGNIRRGYTNLEAGVPVAFQPNGEMLDERGNVVPSPSAGGAAALTVGGPTGGAPPSGAGPIVPGVTPHAGSGTVSASSDTPPTQEVTAGDAGWTQEAQRMFDGGATREQMDAFAARHGRQPYGPVLDQAIHLRDTNPNARIRILPPETRTPAGELAAQADQVQGRQGVSDLLVHGATLGLSDEATGLGGALNNVLSSPFTGNFDPVGAYQANRDSERIRLGETRDRLGWGGTAAEIAGGFASGNPGSLIETAGPTLGGRMLAGTRAGAEIGTVSGYGHGSGLGGSVGGAVQGGVEGGLFGGSIPIVATTARAVGRGARGAYRLAVGENPDLAPRTVAQAIADDANTPGGVGTQMQEAHANDVPYMLADTGDNARGMLAATARAPGAARTLTRDALRQRQEGLPERVTAAIERDLGPASNPHEIAAQLSAQARATAAPLYEAAYARPGAGTFAERMGNMLRRPSMQGALQRAQRIAAEEGRDPNTMGFDVNSSGEVTIGATPSWQTLDYVKRGMDDVIEQSRDSTTGKLNLNTEGHAINDTQRAFLQQFDAANSDYAAARAAYAGPTRANAAMQRGLGGRNGTGPGAMNMTADDFSATINRMTPLEQEMFRLGHRRAMVEHVASGGDHADMVGRLIGTGKRRAAIQRLHGDNENFPRFVSTLRAEQEGHQTYRQAMSGSQTAPNIQDDAALPGAASAALTDLATTGGLPVATGIRQAVKLGVTRVGRNAQQQISTLLSENDPARISEFARVLQEHAAKVSAARAAAARRSPIYGYGAGSAVGSSIQDAYGQ